MESLKELCSELFLQWSERGAQLAAEDGFKRGCLDESEGLRFDDVLPREIAKVFESDYKRGYKAGYEDGNREPEF